MKLSNACLFIMFLVVSMQSLYAGGKHNQPKACSNTAKILQHACGNDLMDDFLTNVAVCVNISDKASRNECYDDAWTERRETQSECRQVFNARRELCRDIGEARYDPPFGEDYADNFVNPLEVGKSVAPNPYFPLVPGNEWVYQGKSINDEGEEELETITVRVTDKTKLIEGITCLVVNDIVTEGEDEDTELVEDTDDWYAQDVEGNVWYCGEIAENFEYFEGDNPEEAELVDTEGSWKSGRDGARAGILFPAFPQVGDVFRQEISWGDAEDIAEILSITGEESSPAASCDGNCLVTKDFTPLEPGVEENKYYVPGVGLIVEVKPGSNDRVELIEFNQN